ncbi:undecaprenyl-diphosphatase [Skermanella aerolata]|uniref:phosphatase PAP2 family protein n=1 Tax=Skermanella aerolata TaxID=393310 RepID=UPI003D24A03F
MHSRFSADLPLARYSVWCLLLLLPGHVFLSYLDRAVYDLIQGAEPHVFLFFRAVTELGDSKWTLVPTGILGLLLVLAGRYGFSGHRPAAVSNWLASASFFVFCSVALSGIVVNVIKVVVGRARPKLIDQNGLTGFEPFTFDGALHSFPSGHTNTIFALALAVSLLVPQWRGGLLAMASVVGFSRIAVGAHFLTDVIAGAALAVPTTVWLRRRFADNGLVFTKGGMDGYALLWPGRLIPIAVARFVRKRVVPIGEPAPRRVGPA